MVVCAGLAMAWIQLGLPRLFCPFRAITGLPCPTCGSTRMVEALAAGNAARAFQSNPMVFLILAGIAIWAMCSLVGRWRDWPQPRVILSARGKQIARLGAWLMLAAGWAYLILAG